MSQHPKYAVAYQDRNGEERIVSGTGRLFTNRKHAEQEATRLNRERRPYITGHGRYVVIDL